MMKIIESFGCKCDLIHNAKEIYEFFDKNYYDLVFADVMTINYDLDTMLNYCAVRFPNIKVVVMSQILNDETVIRFMNYQNVIQVFEKPSENLKDLVSSCLAKVMKKEKV